jgi:hypothetical protein
MVYSIRAIVDGRSTWSEKHRPRSVMHSFIGFGEYRLHRHNNRFIKSLSFDPYASDKKSYLFICKRFALRSLHPVYWGEHLRYPALRARHFTSIARELQRTAVKTQQLLPLPQRTFSSAEGAHLAMRLDQYQGSWTARWLGLRNRAHRAYFYR